MSVDNGTTGGESSSEARDDPTAKKKNRDRILIIVGVIGLVLTFMILRKSSSSATTSSTTSSSASNTQQAYETAVSSNFGAMQTEINTLHNQMAGLSTPSIGTTSVGSPNTPGGVNTSPTVPKPTVAAKIVQIIKGSGYTPKTSGATVTGYHPIVKGTASGLLKSGEKLYYEPAQGSFVGVTGAEASKLKPGTQLYLGKGK